MFRNGNPDWVQDDDWSDSFDDKSDSFESEEKGFVPNFSASAFLRGSFQQNSIFRKKRIAEKEVLLDVLNEVNKTCNMIQVGEDQLQDEKRLRVLFSDGFAINRFDDNVIYINPKVMKNDSDNVFSHSSNEFYDALDALNGQVLLCSYMKRHVPEQEVEKLVSEIRRLEKSVLNIFVTDLQSLSISEISRDWPGFNSYICQARKKFFKTKRQVLLPVLREVSSRELDRFVNLFCYNYLNDDKINFHDFFESEFANLLDECQQILNDGLKNSNVDGQRLACAIDLYSQISTKLNLPQGDSKNFCLDPSQFLPKLDPDGTQQPSNVGTGDIPQKNHGDQQDGDGQEEDEFSSDVTDYSHIPFEFVGDNSFNFFKMVDGTDSASKLTPNTSGTVSRKRNVKDTIKVLNHYFLDGVKYERTEPEVDEEIVNHYNKIMMQNMGLIRSVKNCFNFHNTDYSISSYGLRSGNLDDGSLFKIGLSDFDRLYEQKTIKGKKRWLVSLLLDQSGSMCGPRIYESKTLGIVFTEALRSLHDVEFSCYGFTGHTDDVVRTIVYKEKNFDRLSSLSNADAHSSTPLGYSIGHVSDKMLLQYPDCSQKILFVVTDGDPTVSGELYDDPKLHAQQMCELARKNNIRVFGIGICNAFTQSTGEMMFGPNNFVIINDVASCLSVLTNSLMLFLKQVQ